MGRDRPALRTSKAPRKVPKGTRDADNVSVIVRIWVGEV